MNWSKYIPTLNLSLKVGEEFTQGTCNSFIFKSWCKLMDLVAIFFSKGVKKLHIYA